jgi:EAL domain-containing protein (putative c-di-GMP-specific phosphodiesterase class I)
MVRGLEMAAPARRAVLAAMLQMAAGLGIVTVAEGVETAAEAECCRQLGFDGAQGFLYSRPVSVPLLPR